MTEKKIVDLLGKHIFRYGQAEKTDQVGMATGLAYTAAGGDTLAIGFCSARKRETNFNRETWGCYERISTSCV